MDRASLQENHRAAVCRRWASRHPSEEEALPSLAKLLQLGDVATRGQFDT